MSAETPDKTCVMKVSPHKRSLDSNEESSEPPAKKIPPSPSREITNRPEKIKYRNHGLLLSYCGKDYFGMQLQRSNELNTIEDALLDALVKTGLIEEKGKTTPQNYHFQRASRTDKGVSAVRQIVSLNLPEKATNIAENLNKLLPEDIRVFKVVRVTKSFNSKNWCDSRTYSYLCPTYAFAPPSQESDDFRLSPELYKEINEIFQLYIGCHKYHNFTSGKSFKDPSSQRYIISMEAESPFLREGLEWIRIKVHGHSFMIHQIRKMIGFAMAIAKGFTTKDVIEFSWGAEKVDIPKAPGLGLVLEEPHFNNYNKKFGSDGTREPLSWESVEEELNEFRKNYIDSVIIKSEIEEKSMKSWLSTLSLHVYVGRSEENSPTPDVKENSDSNISVSKNNGALSKVGDCISQDSNDSSFCNIHSKSENENIVR